MNQIQMENCMKVKSALIDIFDNGNLHRYLPTPYLAYEIADSYDNLIKGKSQTTISREVRDFFEVRGFTITTEGIGWKINL